MILKKYIWLIILIFAGSQIIQAKYIKIDSTFSADAEIFPFDKEISISHISMSAKLNLENDLSLIRIILTDINNNEYLVYEAYPYIVDSNIIEFTNESLETAYLDNIFPNSIKGI